MLSASTWVPRGFASEFPEKYELNDDEMERINQLAELNLDDARHDLEEAEQQSEEQINEGSTEEFAHVSKLKDQIEIDDDLKEFDLEHYDDEDIERENDNAMFLGLSKEIKFHDGDAEEDPYVSLPNELDQSEEKKEFQVYPSDNLVLATRTEDDISYLDVYIYDDGAGFHGSDVAAEAGDEQDPDVARGLVRDPSLYVHHDLMLPAFPLCVEWLNYRPGSNNEQEVANFAAIGTFDPAIEIWNLDCVDKAFPDMILGEPVDNSTISLKKTKKKNKNKHITTHHTDAVLSLAHNRQYRAVLASTSADHTVKLWDLNSGTAARSMECIHSKKNVSSSQWHPTNASFLLTGGYDSRVALTDVRIENEKTMSKFWSVSSGEEIECVKFASENVFLCGTDNGNVYSYDIRNGDNSKPIWTLKAHDGSVSSVEISQHIPNMLLTTAVSEKVVKLWKVPMDAESGKGPSMTLSRDFGVGNVLTSSFAPDIEVAGNIVVGGINPGLKLWDVFTNRSVRNSFKDELKGLQHRARDEARQLGRSSRIARKYFRNDNPDTVITIDDQGEDEEEDKDTSSRWVEDEE